MLDLEIIRTQPDIVRDTISKRGGDTGLVDALIELDASWRQTLQAVEAARQERNHLTATKETATKNAAKLKKLKTTLAKLEDEERSLAARRAEAWALVPQIIAPDVPIGEGESANTVIKTVGRVRMSKGKSHEEIMSRLDWLDTETAAKVSGARFRYLKNAAALAEMRLMHQAFEWAIKHGFTPVIPPVIVRGELLLKTGFFPIGREDTFAVDDNFLPGTSEPQLIALAGDQVHDAAALPKRFVGFSTCFRREAGSYGRDTKGMIRQHQFDKVEMVSICAPEESEKEHQFLISMQEKFIAQFKLPYQVVLIGSGDLETKATKRYDIETYFPSQERYRETHSGSNCGDYQARSFGIKIKNNDGTERFAHTLNATLATERLLLAIIENNQRPDGSVNLPKSLR